MVFFFIIKIPFCDLTVADRYAANEGVTRGPDACDRFEEPRSKLRGIFDRKDNKIDFQSAR